MLPLLLYYALLHQFKTSLYLSDPEYPPSSSVLQHGISARRSKRDTYRWPLDYIHVFREGVFQSWLLANGHTQPLPNRLILGDLLGTLPDLVPLLTSFYPHFIHVYEVSHTPEAKPRSVVSRSIAANRQLTVTEWKQQYLDASPMAGGHADAVDDKVPPGQLALPTMCDNVDHPWLRRLPGGRHFLVDGPVIPELAAHFVLLYSLSSLCRYSPVEWTEIVHWQNEIDAAVVRTYLAYAATAVLNDSLI